MIEAEHQTFFLTDWNFPGWKSLNILKGLWGSLKIFEEFDKVLQKNFKDLCCFFMVMNKLTIFKGLSKIFIKIFEDLQ